MTFPGLTAEKQENESRKIRRKIETIDEMIISHIKKVLKETGGKVDGKGGAAEILNINPSTLRGKMRKYGIIKKVVF